MSEVDLTRVAPAVNPSFTATGIFPSGLNASGRVDMPSGFMASGLEASALVKGTIGNFLATALAGSAVYTSGPVKAGASGVFASGVNTSGAVTAPSIVVTSVINVSGPEAATSLIAASSLQLSAGAASLTGSLFVQSGIQTSGTFLGSAASMTDMRTSTFTASALASITGGLNVSGTTAVSALNAAVTSATDLRTSTLTASAKASAPNLATSLITFADATQQSTAPGGVTSTFSSGLTTCALMSVGASMIVDGTASFGASVAFQSGFNTSANAALGGLITAYNGVNTSGRGLANNRANATEFQLSGIGSTTVITFTPSAAGNFLVLAYFRVSTATTSVSLNATWTDVGGAQVYTWVNSLPETVGSYTVIPLYINSNAAAISVVAQAFTANQVLITATIVEL